MTKSKDWWKEELRKQPLYKNMMAAEQATLEGIIEVILKERDREWDNRYY